jgi:xylose isomerase
MAGLNMTHAVAQAWEAGKLFHIDLNDQIPGRYDQDFRFGSANPRQAFFLVKFLEEVSYQGMRAFDAHAYRTEDYEGVKEFARGCIRTYLILKDKARRWHEDAEIQSILAEINEGESGVPQVAKYSRELNGQLAAYGFDRQKLAGKRLPYERLDQLTTDILLGVR